MKIELGKKGNIEKGFAFAPYIKISELILPVKLIGFDKNKEPIFIKNEKRR